MTPLFHKVGAIVLLLAGIAIAVAVRMRCSRDRRRIGEELARRGCRFIAARAVLRRFRFFGASAYEVEYLDDEDDLVQATCTVRRGVVTWAEDLQIAAPTSELLPTYGQNWRG